MKMKTRIHKQSIPKTIEFLEMCRKQIRENNFPGGHEIETNFKIAHGTWAAALAAGFFVSVGDGRFQCEIKPGDKFTERDAMDVLSYRAKYQNEKRAARQHKKLKYHAEFIDMTDDGFIDHIRRHPIYHETVRCGFKILIEKKEIIEL